MRITLLFLASLLVLPVGLRAAEPLDVSIVQLIATPQQFDGKKVRIMGVAKIEFEGNAIYLHREDLQFFLTRNGLWLDVPRENTKKWATLSGKYVRVEGTFSASNRGHMDLWSGAIKNISRFEDALREERAAAVPPNKSLERTREK